MIYRSESYRLRALSSEQRAREASDYLARAAWTEIAIEWHALAFRTAQESSDCVVAD
jgi:hypothetical protein